MIVNKKLKTIEEKGKSKVGQAKKVKKQKNSSPSKLKATPQKKKIKKDENSNYNKPVNASIYQPQFYKSKESQRHSNNHKKSQNHNKSKLLTTSPIYFDNQKSRSKSKSKSKSKSISVSKLNTYRSTQDKQFNKSINKKLFSQTKQNKQRSKSKSKSKSRLKYDRQVSPLKQIKKFNVADRQIKYNKNETNQLKRTLKKKIQSTRLKSQNLVYPPQPIQQPIQQPKVKLKKKVPQIKTEFSERRGSYFDQNLLRKLQINHQEGKKNQLCPFMHIKSNFQEKMQEYIPFHSKSDSKVPLDQIPQSFSSQNQQVEIFKREQERRWKLMLSQLKNLKNEPKVSQRIDVLIEYLNQNYVSLQERAHELSSKDPKSIQSNPLNEQFQSIHDSVSRKNSMAQQLLHQLLLPNNVTFDKNQHLPNNEYQKQPSLTVNELLPKSSQSSFRFLSPILEDNNPKSLINSQQREAKQAKEEGNMENEPKEIEQQNSLAFKRSNNINLSEFYNFIEKKDLQRKVQFQPFLKINHEQGINYSLQLIKYESQHRISDKNILNDLNILQNSQDFLDINEAFKQKNSQFKEQMQIATKEDNGYSNFHNEVRMNEEMSSESMLLNMSDNNVKRGQKLVDEIQQTLIMQFCVNILRSKGILHNFITTYSQLVESNAINVQMCFQDPKNAIQSSNQYVKTIISRLVNHIEVNYKQPFMKQIKLPFQCKPIEILRYIRSSEEEVAENSFEDEENPLQVPYFNEEMIEEFEINVLKNQYFIPGYFSFNHCIYDEFNDIVEQLRPYGSHGKAIFSRQLSHPIVNFEIAKEKIFSKVQKHLSEKYYQQNIPDEKYPNEDGIFQLVYYTSLQLVQIILQLEVEQIAKTINKSNLKKHAR